MSESEDMRQREVYHHMSPRNKELITDIETRTYRAIDKILWHVSGEVVDTDGYFVKQSGGQFYLMYEKKFLLQPRYFMSVGEYLVWNNKQMTLEAKRVFESGDEEMIREFMERMRNF